MFNHEGDTPEKEEAASVQLTALLKKHRYSTSTESQRQRILEALRVQPLSTIKMRSLLDVLGVAPRIFELRRKLGYDIRTLKTWEPTECGKLHRVAYYHLIGEAHNPPTQDNQPSASRQNKAAKLRERDLENWRLALLKTNPAFAKTFITGRLLESGAIDDAGAVYLLETLNLGEV